jgi:hypothetical protein
MSDVNKVTELLDNAVKTGLKAIELQASFYQNFSSQQGEALARLADSRISNLKELVTCTSIESAIEKNNEFNSHASEALEVLHVSNTAALEDLSAALKDLYQA